MYRVVWVCVRMFIMFRKAEANFQTDDVFICLSVILPFYDRACNKQWNKNQTWCQSSAGYFYCRDICSKGCEIVQRVSVLLGSLVGDVFGQNMRNFLSDCVIHSHHSKQKPGVGFSFSFVSALNWCVCVCPPALCHRCRRYWCRVECVWSDSCSL